MCKGHGTGLQLSNTSQFQAILKDIHPPITVPIWMCFYDGIKDAVMDASVIPVLPISMCMTR